MRRIDELYLASPFAEARMLRDLLRREGHRIGRKRVRTVMARMGSQRYTPQTQYQPATSGASGVPLSAPSSGDHPIQPGLGG